MGRLSSMLSQVRAQFSKLGASQRLLLASLGIILGMALLLVALYAGKPGMVELMPAGGNQQLLASLRGAGIEAQEQGGTIVVPQGLQTAALAHLDKTGQLPDDTRLRFSNILGAQSWQNSREQNRQIWRIAQQNELAEAIAGLDGVREARVFLDVPEPTGLGAAVRQATAAVTVLTDSGSAVAQETVDGVAHMISGAVAGIDVGNVRVIDAATGRQRRPRREGDLVATSALELSVAWEEKTRDGIYDALSYIPGVIVSVTAQVDATKREGQEQRYFSPDEGGTTSFVTQEDSTQTTSGTTTPGSQPGARSNATADISRGTGDSGTSTESNTSTTSIQPFVGSRTERYVDPRGGTTVLAVSVNVPEGFVLGLASQGLEDGEEADPAAIEAKWVELQGKIKAAIVPHVRAMTPGGEGVAATAEQVDEFVQVLLVPGDVPVMSGMGGGGGLLASLGSGGGGIGGLGGLVDKAMLGVLAVVAIGLMFTLVKKASQQVEMPTAEELVGVPPTLETPSDLIGEADESDMAMAGIEIGEDQVKSRRMLEEVAKMVETNPDAAARLMKQWISAEG